MNNSDSIICTGCVVLGALAGKMHLKTIFKAAPHWLWWHVLPFGSLAVFGGLAALALWLFWSSPDQVLVQTLTAFAGAFFGALGALCASQGEKLKASRREQAVKMQECELWLRFSLSSIQTCGRLFDDIKSERANTPLAPGYLGREFAVTFYQGGFAAHSISFLPPKLLGPLNEGKTERVGLHYLSNCTRANLNPNDDLVTILHKAAQACKALPEDIDRRNIARRRIFDLRDKARDQIERTPQGTIVRIEADHLLWEEYFEIKSLALETLEVTKKTVEKAYLEVRLRAKDYFRPWPRDIRPTFACAPIIWDNPKPVRS